MRVGVNCFLLIKEVGGLKQYFFNLFDHLLAHDRSNEYVFLHYPQNEEHLAHLRSDRWKTSAIRMQYQEDILKHLDRIDLYFCPFGSLYPRPLPCPTVFTLPDIQEQFFPEFWTRHDLFNRALHFKGSTHMADAVVTLSEFSKRTIVDAHKIPQEKVFVAHLSTDERFARAEDVARRPESFTLTDDFVFFPANRWFHKNHATLLRALRLLRDEKRLKIHAVFTGCDIEGHYQLKKGASELGLADCVHEIGYVTVEQLAWLYRNARMLVFPSLFEGFGLPLVEAMNAGCPIVAARATSLPEIGGDAAAYFDPQSPPDLAAAIEKLWQNGALRADLVARGRERAKQFSPARTAEAHLDAFRFAAARYRKTKLLWDQYVWGRAHWLRVALQYRDVVWPKR